MKKYLESGKANPFLIPEYQRPYAWGEDQITTLFDDLKEFTGKEEARELDEEDSFREGTYFLGSIVTYLNDSGVREVIDGQQRLTSLMLLLRAIYTKLQSVDEKSKSIESFIGQIEPCLWKTDRYDGTADYAHALIHSDAMDDEYNSYFQLILETGETDPDWNDNYSNNYRLLKGFFDNLCTENPLMIYRFIDCVLNRAIVLPIQADDQDTALTIFSTLNDRGLPLSDADIFKAKIYGGLEGSAREEFVQEWKYIESQALDIDENMQDLFYIYMFYRRALKNDTKTTTPGARKYFEKDKYAKLHEPDVLKHIQEILTLVTVIKRKAAIDDEGWSNNPDILKIFDMFELYPTEWWQYPAAVFYLTHKEKNGFEEAFLAFLRKLFTEMLRIYIVSPNVSSIKGGIMKLNVASISTMHPIFDFRKFDVFEDAFDKSIVRPHNKIRGEIRGHAPALPRLGAQGQGE